MNTPIRTWSEIVREFNKIHAKNVELEKEIKRIRSNSAYAWRLQELTTAERDVLYPTPFNGLMVYNSTVGAVQAYYAAAWNSL